MFLTMKVLLRNWVRQKHVQMLQALVFLQMIARVTLMPSARHRTRVHTTEQISGLDAPMVIVRLLAD